MTPTKTRPHKPMLAEWTCEILSLSLSQAIKQNLDSKASATPPFPIKQYHCRHVIGTRWQLLTLKGPTIILTKKLPKQGRLNICIALKEGACLSGPMGPT